MRYLWNMLNKEFTIEGAVSAFLVINMIGWMAWQQRWEREC